MAQPDVTVIMPNFNCGSYIEDAITSALSQKGCQVEVVVVDDASTDDSVDRAGKVATQNPGRVKVISLPVNSGSAIARNAALSLASGRWIAVLDSDDLMAPNRLRRLIDEAEKAGADIVADDLIHFYSEGTRRPHRHLGRPYTEEPRWITLETFVAENNVLTTRAALGYLKTVIRAERWRASEVWYDPKLRLAQDYDFVLRLLEKGLSYLVLPSQGYLYRRHSNSNSYRAKASHIEALLEADRRFELRLDPKADGVRVALRRRMRSLMDVVELEAFVNALKRRNFGEATRLALKNPRLPWHLVRFNILARWQKIRTRWMLPSRDGLPSALVLALALPVDRQPENGLLAEAASELRNRGLKPILVSAGEAAASVRSVFRLDSALRDYAAVHIQGFSRLGPYFFRQYTNKRVRIAEGQNDEDALYVAIKAPSDVIVIVLDGQAAQETSFFAIAPKADVLTVRAGDKSSSKIFLEKVSPMKRAELANGCQVQGL